MVLLLWVDNIGTKIHVYCVDLDAFSLARSAVFSCQELLSGLLWFQLFI